MRNLITLCLIVSASTLFGQIKDFQIKGNTPKDTLWILGTDTASASPKYGLGKWYNARGMGAFGDSDWLRWRTNTIPNNADTMYHVGPVVIGEDTLLLSVGGFGQGSLNVAGIVDFRYPDASGTSIAIGAGSMLSGEGGGSNIAIGQGVMADITTADHNVIIGDLGYGNVTSGDFNTAVGFEVMGEATGLGAQSNVVVGYKAGSSGSLTQQNVLIGGHAGIEGCTSFNTILGYQAGASVPVSSNVFIGYQSGNLNTGSGNVFIGKESAENETGSNKLYIENSNSATPLIFGDFSADTLRVNGKLSYSTNGSTPTTLAGRSTHQFSDVATGWGLDLTSGTLLADSSQVATQYDLTTLGSGTSDHDWYEVGGSTPPNHIDDNMFSGTGNHGIGTTSPSKPLHVVGEARITGSGGTATTITGRDTDEDLTDVTTGWGIDLTSGALIVDSTEVATKYDLTTVLAGGMTNWLLAASGTGGTEEVNQGETVTITAGTGITATRSGGNVTVATTVVDTDTDDQNLTIEGAGPTYQVAINDGTDVTVSGTGIITLSESPANTLVIDATEVDGSVSNEIQTLTVTGAAAPYTLDLSGTIIDAALNASGIITLTESPANTIVIGATEVDGSVSNELNTIEEFNSTVQTGNITIDYQPLFDVATDGATEVNVSLDLSESTTVTTVESDDYIIMHDASPAQHQKILWTDIYNDLITFQEDNATEGLGNILDVGTGIDMAFASDEADLSLDFNEFTTDAATEGDEYVIVYDPNGVPTHEKVLVTSVGGFDGNGFFSIANDGGTIPAGMNGVLTDTWQLGDAAEADLYVDSSSDRIGLGTSAPSYGIHALNDAGMAVESATSGTGGLIFKLEGKADGGGANIQQTMLQMAYTDADYAAGVEQTALEMVLDKRADLTQNTTVTFRLKEATDADIVLEKNADFGANATESHVAINGGMAFTNNYEWTATAADLALDRAYHIVTVSGAGAVGDEITLPEVNSTSDNWDSALTAIQAQVGQTYEIANFRAATNLVVRCFTADLFLAAGGTSATLTIAPNSSARIKCVRFNGGVGYWTSHTSD